MRQCVILVPVSNNAHGANFARTDSAGKRRSKALEAEFANLRDELERVRKETLRVPSSAHTSTNDEGDLGSDSSKLLSELAADAEALILSKGLALEPPSTPLSLTPTLRFYN